MTCQGQCSDHHSLQCLWTDMGKAKHSLITYPSGLYSDHPEPTCEQFPLLGVPSYHWLLFMEVPGRMGICSLRSCIVHNLHPLMRTSGLCGWRFHVIRRKPSGTQHLVMNNILFCQRGLRQRQRIRTCKLLISFPC